jgi:hypothetical protein
VAPEFGNRILAVTAEAREKENSPKARPDPMNFEQSENPGTYG